MCRLPSTGGSAAAGNRNTCVGCPQLGAPRRTRINVEIVEKKKQCICSRFFTLVAIRIISTTTTTTTIYYYYYYYYYLYHHSCEGQLKLNVK